MKSLMNYAVTPLPVKFENPTTTSELGYFIEVSLYKIVKGVQMLIKRTMKKR